ncbi:GlsB/YeaQ/YmgE family stress response membrane protein [Kocuria sp. JC486]|uniref:GlsB/YeaQ/YmgE family stress response membrane protein n=1 Tax=Kocuria soli TaxID=2485125 RepID=A0A3N3ZNK9_9MICC|nr:MULTISPECIES: GlsB/YeaQ/YmgE family stress response membrane protein [Kocuria]NHU85126.1 GlsB/YeaQ/YmgE family stress response membrane protein [Kocuria sp. JC486]ROZ62456.1 GlsB/YeaQ/YmgE family stress response membrane protein [Kocuria soli]
MIGSIIAWIVLGLIAGALAKLIMPGKQGGGIIATILLGIVGAFVGGLISMAIPGLSGDGSVISIGSIILAIIGALLVLFIWGLIAGRGNRAPRR